ncbi:hypothetical protein ACE1TF_05325 [Geomicrobium sp. JSM 1781026]|uniref:hypothetical protein n=1 Tax=Geomicrobium sp. JSM 1781026 TaxID=3344580 RepID=UPI0035BF368A
MSNCIYKMVELETKSLINERFGLIIIPIDGLLVAYSRLWKPVVRPTLVFWNF